jgi:hypothetical protein
MADLLFIRRRILLWIIGPIKYEVYFVFDRSGICAAVARSIWRLQAIGLHQIDAAKVKARQAWAVSSHER